MTSPNVSQPKVQLSDDEWRKKQAEATAARKAETQKKAAEIAAYRRRLKDAGLLPERALSLLPMAERQLAALKP